MLALVSSWVSPGVRKMFHSPYDAAVILRVCCTIQHMLTHICPDNTLQTPVQWYGDSSNATALDQSCCKDGAPNLLSTCPKAAEQMS
jgi:hypothetical protein